MLRILVVTLTLTALLAFHLVNGTPTAFACSGSGPVEGMLRSPIIIEGRVIAAVPPTSPVAERPNQAPLVLAFEVDLAHRGASAGSRLDALTYVWSSSFPNPCAALALPEDLVGQYLVIGLDAPESSGGLPLTGVAAFIGEEPAGAEYERGHKVAVMIADSDPTAPIIELRPAAPACGEPFQATGRHFPQGRYVLRGSYDPRVLAVTKVGATGELVMSGIFRPSACAHAQNNGRLTGLWVIAMDGLIPGGGYLSQDALTEVVAMTLTGALDGPDLGFPLQVTPNPARCGELITITGTGFLAGERLNLGYNDNPPAREVVASAEGTISADLRLPDGECAGGRNPGGDGYGSVWLAQAEFELASPLVALASGEVRLAPLASAPGIVFEPNKTLYYYPSDRTTSVTVRGLTKCAGASVQIGLAILDFDGPTVTAAVDADGTAHAVLPLPTTSFRDRHFGVAGDCVPNGFVVSEQTIAIIPRDPPGTPTIGPGRPPEATPTVAAPGPPDTGSGKSQRDRRSAVSVTMAVIIAGFGAMIIGLAAAQRRRRG